MTTTNTYNLNNEQLIKRIGVSGDFDNPQLFEIKIIYRRIGQNEHWQIHSSLIVPVYKEKENFVHTYENTIFIKRYEYYSSIKEIITALGDNGIPINIDNLPSLSIRNDRLWQEVLIPTIHSDYACPIRHCTIDTGISDYGNDKLISHNLPFYSSFNERAIEFIPCNSNNKCINILVEESRARIELNNGIATALSNIDASIVGKILYKNKEKTKKVTTKTFPYEIELSEAIDVDLWLIDSNNIVYDYISTTEYPYTYTAEHTDITKEDFILEKISNGETIDCEFKKFIDLKKGDTKSEEIDRTACSFSNTKGGVIIFGVSDTGKSIGIDEQVRKSYNSNLEDSTSSYVNDIAKRLCENLAHNECFSVHPIKLYGKQMIIVTVTKSTGWNTLQSCNTPYARKGSTNYNATRLALLELESNKRNPY